MLRTTAIWISVFLLGLMGTGCGYLDNDLFVDEATYAQELEFEGLSISGFGTSSGCGGYGYHSRRHRMPSIYGTASLNLPTSNDRVDGMSDDELLNNTDVEMIDETGSMSAQPGMVEYLYHQQRAARDEGVEAFYSP